MENLTLDELKLITQQTQNPSISIYMPTHRAGQDTLQDPIRFKNLLRESERQLLERGMGRREVAALLQPAQAMQDNASFWQHGRDGLAAFIAPEDFHYYRLPFSVEEQLVIARSYYVKPILPLFTNNGHYYILAISQNEVRLFEGTRHSVGQIDLPDGTPESLDEALQYDDPEKQLQFHTGTAQGGARAGVFHGHGAGDEEQKVRIERYLNKVDAGLREFFRDQPAPLVLSGVDYLLPIYRSVSEYAHIMEEGIEGNPERLRPEELQERAWPIVEPHFRQEMEQVVEQYHQFAGTGKASDDIREVVTAAISGRVDTLILAVEAQVWGTYDSDAMQVVHHQADQSQEDDIPLLDFAAMQTIQNGGTVYALRQDEMPTKSPSAAVFRY